MPKKESRASGRGFSYLDQRAFAALRAISRRSSGVRRFARARPPILPPFARLGAADTVSSSSPVAILATMTAVPITSAGRFWPWGPFGIAIPWCRYGRRSRSDDFKAVHYPRDRCFRRSRLGGDEGTADAVLRCSLLIGQKRAPCGLCR